MGWSISFRIRTDRQWSEADIRSLRAHQQKWTLRLSSRSEPYSVVGLCTNGDFHAALKPEAQDYVTVVYALRELQQLFPGLDIEVSDDSGLNLDTPLGDIDVDDLGANLREELGEGAGEEGADDDEIDAEFAEVDRIRHELALSRAQPLLEQAARDFAIWKSAQLQKKTT